MRYFSMFSGIGGFEKGIGNKGTCIGFSEIDKYAIQIYQQHFKEHKNYGDASRIIWESTPDFDVFVGGFPCQAFSIAGKRGGFKDTRGTLFFEVARALSIKRPKLCVLENVKGLLSHNKGATFGTILTTLSELGYFCEWQVLNSKDFGVPQNRERVFIIGYLGGPSGGQVFPIGSYGTENTGGRETQVASTLQARDYKGPDQRGSTTLIADYRNDEGLRIRKNNISPTLTSTHTSDGKTDVSMCPPLVLPVLTPDRLEKRQNGRRFKENGDPAFTLTAQDKHGVSDGMKIRRLTPVECERLQGFPDGWTEEGVEGKVSDTQRYKCLGNAVTVNVIKAIFKGIYEKGNIPPH